MEIFIAVLALAGSLKCGDAITGWTTPSIAAKDGTETLDIQESQPTGSAIETVQADSADTPITYSITPPVTPFTLTASGNTADLSITTSLDARTLASYTLVIEAVDSAATPITGTITITVTVTAAPKFTQTSYKACIASGATTDATLTTVLASDIDAGSTVTHSITSGNTNTDFKIDGASGLIQVNTGKTMVMDATYTLVVEAVDNEGTPQTGTTTVSVEVTKDGVCSGATAVVVSLMAILMALVTTM